MSKIHLKIAKWARKHEKMADDQKVTIIRSLPRDDSHIELSRQGL